MKRLIFILTIIWLLSNNLFDQVPSNDKNWEVVFIDDFNTLDTTRWNVANNFDHYGEPQMYTNRTDNVYISNGNLILKIIKENYISHSFTSGWINTKINYQYGYFEIRCKLPNCWIISRIWSLVRSSRINIEWIRVLCIWWPYLCRQKKHGVLESWSWRNASLAVTCFISWWKVSKRSNKLVESFGMWLCWRIFWWTPWLYWCIINIYHNAVLIWIRNRLSSM